GFIFSTITNIGSRSGAVSFFNGLIDDLKVYNYVLTPWQIAQEYNGGKPIAYYKMDEATTTWDGAGDRVNDYSGLGNNGTAYGHAHATTTAVYGNAAEFDGTDDYVHLGDTGNNFGTTQTVSAWIYPRVITGNNFRIYATGSGSAYPYTIGIYGNNNVSDALYSSIPLVLNTWQYITVVTTGSQAAAKLYINGVDRTGAQGGSGFIFSTITNIGSRSGAVSFFNGLIDDLKVYNYVLTPWQIAQEYNNIIVLTAVSAPTFGAVATSSIEVIKPLTAAENIADLYQWQVKRNNAVELGFIATSTTSITDFSLLENTPYIYTVQFKDNANNFGSYGIAATKYTLTNVPVNITVSANNSVTVNSFPNDTLDSSGYYFEDTTLNTNSGWIQTNVWNDGGLLCGSNYNFFVKYRNGDGAETEAITLSQTMGACSESSSGGGSSNNQPTAQPIAVPSNQTVVENQQPDINPAEVKVISPTLGEDLVLLLNQTRNQELETAVANGLKVRLSEISSLTLEQQQTLSNFIVYGTVETKKMGLGERAGSVYSFDSAFNKLPQTEQDWSDVLKICLGRLPNQRSEVKEEQAKTDFNKIYLKEPAVNSQQDQTTLNIMSYGIRPVDRNLSSEIKAADYFKTIYNELPQTTNEWDLMRAISYGGATR
ncbi:MAG: hypothetical protein NTZ18_04140, partial [Candidatus Komeilibacteria bacterium]|nr:hypothetical protein [Candidatus Komeilibacteria bacterium]